MLIYKKGNALEIKNYRPIALGPSIPYSKSGKKYSSPGRMCTAPDIKNIIDPTQFGYIGACDAILAMNTVNDANKGIATFTATLDLSKAYNRVNPCLKPKA